MTFKYTDKNDKNVLKKPPKYIDIKKKYFVSVLFNYPLKFSTAFLLFLCPIKTPI